MSTSTVNRRSFIQSTGASALALGVANRVLGANEKVNIGVIGTGGRGQALIRAMTNIEGIHIAAICDKREDRVNAAARFCEQYEPKTKIYSGFHKLIETEKLDGIVVATEVGNHAEVVVPVLEAGFNCFSEKPMEANVEKVDKIVKAARKAKGIFQVGFQRRYAPGFQKAIEALHGGAIGDVRLMQGQWHFPWSTGGWILDADMSGGNIVEQACHHFDVMQWAMKGQHPVTCMAMGNRTMPYDKNNAPEHISEDYTCVVYRFPNGETLSYTHVFYDCEAFDGEKLWVYGTTGGIDLVKSRLYPRPEQGEEKQLGESAPNWEYGTVFELEAFSNHIRKNEQPLSNVETARVSTLMAQMARMSLYNRETKKFEPRVITWKDLGTTTDV